MDQTNAVRAMGALAQTHRLGAYRALVVAGQQGLSAGAIAEQLAVSPAALSFHLKELMFAELVTQTRDGRNLIYRTAFDRMNELVAFLTSNCCEGRPCGLQAAAPCDC